MSTLSGPSPVDGTERPLAADRTKGKPVWPSEQRGAAIQWDRADVLVPVALGETERRFTFRGLPQAVGAARRALREWESYFQPDLFYDLSLCVSELVTSKVQHAAGNEIELAVRRDEKLFRAEITDPRGDVEVTEPPVTSPADWGMFIIDHVADRWGVDRSAGTLVWCEIDLARRKARERENQAQTRAVRRRDR
jgi:anti-sigma regulatory factor (Ser/Thr protein kinase)